MNQIKPRRPSADGSYHAASVRVLSAAPVFDRDGSLLVGDDFGNTMWRVTPPEE